ncbi:diguanylate cyclase (GGDEF) domain-containing protein [Desulfomicrobium norvegicum]|uniref:diguanylate cyclase n=1 Tax=Desulfomicrobium norvegicum (strain DSM 1741 / NCIMB 8310) TaxID=52561 RepID=A0A8G2F530_DESNO|nr:diguanylate cyclase [Desulfomicrobium norvegicum]SFL44347.1 diguanylate cyclase (GGDEF) domain-containing protein [Desulfomicrobium norvegicum]
MSVRAKVFTIILVLFASLGVADFFVQRFVVYPSFLELEHQQAGQNLQRIFHAIDRENYHLERICRDWATWDDTYDFMNTRSETYKTSNLYDEALDSISVNVMIYCAQDGTIVWSNARDTIQKSAISLDLLTQGRIAPDHPLLKIPGAKEGQKGITGVVNTERGPLLFATRQILRSDGSGPGNGFLVIGRILNQDMVKTLGEQTRIAFEIVYPYAKEQTLCGKKEVTYASIDNLDYFTLDEGEFVKVCGAYLDPTGLPIFGIHYLFPRDITQKGISSIRYAMVLVVSSGLLVLVLLNVLLQAVVLRPLQRLTRHAARLQQEGDYSLRIDLQRNDEVGILAKSFDNMVQTIRERTEDLKRANEQLKQLSLLDGLTGVANRRMFDNCLKQEWRRAMRDQTPIGIILADVDFFKDYNDKHGHLQGDQCLIAVAAVMQRMMQRPADLVTRFGGEEFAVILADTDAEGVTHVAEAMRQAVLDLHLEHGASQVGPFVTVSFGVASMTPRLEDGDDGMAKLLQKADNAMYQAKRSGRNRVVASSDDQPAMPSE